MISIIVVLAIAGFVAWLVMQIPMPQPFRNVILGVMILFLVLWVLQSFGILAGIPRLTLK